MWTTDKVGVKTFKYDDWKLEQHFGSVHFTNCKKYCNCQTWHTYYSSDFAPTIVDASSSIISATTWFPSITVPDQISESVCLAHSKFFSWRPLSTVKTFPSRCLPNLPSLWIKPLNSLLSLTILRSARLNALRPRLFVPKKNASRPFSAKYLIE